MFVLMPGPEQKLENKAFSKLNFTLRNISVRHDGGPDHVTESS